MLRLLDKEVVRRDHGGFAELDSMGSVHEITV